MHGKYNETENEYCCLVGWYSEMVKVFLKYKQLKKELSGYNNELFFYYSASNLNLISLGETLGILCHILSAFVAWVAEHKK